MTVFSRAVVALILPYGYNSIDREIKNSNDNFFLLYQNHKLAKIKNYDFTLGFMYL